MSVKIYVEYMLNEQMKVILFEISSTLAIKYFTKLIGDSCSSKFPHPLALT